ncbi:nuclear pore complex protein Nup160 homolog [Phlebotomus argentipes]|uniref:nuclear pore complex protein Nup160 homolog n=1 Tax=Phlebotomus argentipes TaxID=94469 RepID=UPI0028932A9F|nr:nuclear pore complex protein Nup160 homolog [Phlebotomus argentipes]
MEDTNLRYREVIPNQSIEEKWKEITLTIGGTQSTLQDIRIAEKAGGFCYADGSNLQSRNRFIYWRTSHDILELSEMSLDLNLMDNNVRYKFSESRILAVSIHELREFVVILVATVSSVHRLYYPHPNQLHKTFRPDTKCMSIFKDASVTHARDPLTFHMIGLPTSTNQPITYTAACGMDPQGSEAYFALAWQNTLTLYTMNCSNGHTIATELRQSNMVPRILSSFTGVLRGKTTSNNQCVNSALFYMLGDETFLFTLYRDNFLRMWSLSSGQCVATLNCHEENAETKFQSPQNSTLRCGKSNTICAFMCYASGCEFVFVSIQPDPLGGSNHTLSIMNIILAPNYDLVEYQLTENRIWGLFCNSEGEYKVSSVCFVPGMGVDWTCAALDPLPDRFSVQMEMTTDPRQAYCSYIFQPGRFQRNVIGKALVMFRRSNILPDNNYPINLLKDRVCTAVATEIENEVRGLDMPDEEYIEICLQVWERFYSCCEQYHLKSCQPIGLIPLQMESLDTVCIVKKNMFSLLRRCEFLEHCILSGNQMEAHEVTQIPMELGDNAQQMENLVKLVAILNDIEQQIPDEDKLDIDRQLYQLQMPINIVYNLVKDMLAGENDKTPLTRAFLTQIRQKTLNIKDVPEAMHSLLETLRLDFGSQEEIRNYPSLDQSMQNHARNLFASQFGISLVSESLQQISDVRYVLCRNLLILQHILIDITALASDVLENIRSHQMPETEVFVQAYFVIVWIAKTSADPGLMTNSLDSSINRLNALQLSDARQYLLKTNQPCTLLELFLKSKGWQMALSHYTCGNYRMLTEHQGQTTLLPLATIVGQLVWPVSGNFAFGAWLIGSCQHNHIQTYVRLLNGWCEWNKCSRQFMLGVSMLDSGEVDKAYDLFIQASRGVYTEPFLMEKIIGQDIDGDVTTGEAIVMYYLKVIRLFEQYNALHCVIRVAQSAIELLEPKHPQMAMFQSIMFTNHLALSHYEEAYHSLISNVEASRRKDYLRELVMCLFHKKRLDLLMRFPYIGLQDELENIIETRARSMPIEDNIHYNFLYAFFITKDNMRKAAAVMYEQAMRFGYESNSLEAMQYRYDCLLACVNALNLVDKEYAWIAKPVSNKEDSSQLDKVVVLEIEDIRRELHYIEATITLSRHRRELSTILKVGAGELVGLLATSRLFTAAIKLARAYKLSPTVVVENLASACVHASAEQSNEIWMWLQENDLADLPLKNSPVAMAWNLLEKIVVENEEKGTTVLRRVVAKRILHLGAFLPYWLFLSYKRENPSELLHLFVIHGHLLEATDFAVAFISSMLGSNYEAFGLRNSLRSNEAALCFPVHDIDLLLHALKLNFEYDTEYEEAHKKLTRGVEDYLTAVDSVSMSKIQYELQGC